ncbi:MAG: energy-coupling factor transporter transmembrane protein EcfT [Lachnospiraceae bacterium]|nr:energy-coupling factor transporter transmembrane protein EcfT [Lachnospiraceae bacterium]
MAGRVLTYEKKNTRIHELSGVTKLVFFLLWSITSMITYDTRVLATMIVLSLVILRASKTEWRQVGSVFKFVMVFLVLNVITIYLFAPYQGTEIYGTKTVIAHIYGRYDITLEQLFYELNIVLKYATVVPSAFMFVVSTDPSEFAASLNRVGISYYVAYSIAIALRYIPDVQDDFVKIKNAEAARGIELSKKAGLVERIKNTAPILFPLIFSSMNRIDVVSNAMELRGFGKHRKRTWYRGKPLVAADYAVMVFTVLFCTAALILTFHKGSRFYNPFL